MKRLLQFGCAIAIVATAFLLPRAGAKQQSAQLASDQTALTTEQIRGLLGRVIANQHRNDVALDTFERLEHHVERNGSDRRITEDKLYRVVPTGSGNLKLLVKENNQAVPPNEYRRQLREWERVLEIAIHANDPRELASVAKQKKKLKDRERLINSVAGAYLFTWAGREMRDGRLLERIQLSPNPAYQPRGDSTDWLVHARAMLWIDPSAAQLVRADAEIIRDISIGGGILGKVYRGGHFIMEQVPVAQGLWEASLYQYDISGRKFLFTFTLHEVTSLAHYRLIGAPDQALLVVRDDLANCCSTFIGDP
ncbi:MAG TPA: hypothetical protein VGU63_02240 [Candidatus Acidoferrales bacterium]|nr:hypothetical protein [Candidatus Acidoferrales bacterium]